MVPPPWVAAAADATAAAAAEDAADATVTWCHCAEPLTRWAGTLMSRPGSGLGAGDGKWECALMLLLWVEKVGAAMTIARS